MLSQRLNKGRAEARKEEGEDGAAKIVAVDLQLMAPIPGVVQIHGDITKVVLNSELTRMGKMPLKGNCRPISVNWYEIRLLKNRGHY